MHAIGTNPGRAFAKQCATSFAGHSNHGACTQTKGLDWCWGLGMRATYAWLTEATQPSSTVSAGVGTHSRGGVELGGNNSKVMCTQSHTGKAPVTLPQDTRAV
jgi:hypothetical protein